MQPVPNASSLSTWAEAESLIGPAPPRAEALYLRLVDDRMFAVPSRLRLSLIAQRRGDLRGAVAHALAATPTDIDDADAIAMLCKRLFTLGEIESALDIAARPLLLEADSVSAVAEIGKLMTDVFKPALALRLLRRARELALDTPGLTYLIGLSLMYCGQLDEAAEEFERCLAAAPNFARTHWALAKLQRSSPTRNHIDRLRAAIAAARAGSELPLLYFAMHKELDDLGDTAAAWEALEAGMRARRAQVQYDRTSERALFDLLLSFVPPLPTLSTQGTGEEQVPIFILGMPRSGTTLLERVLANHPDVADGGELHDFVLQLRWMCNLGGSAYLDHALASCAQNTAIDWSMLGARYLSHTRFRARGRRLYTDKMPANFLTLGYILAALPQAKILHVTRNSMDTCFSNLKELFAGAYPHTYDQLEMADHYLDYRRLMAHWHRVAPGRILDVAYEDLVAQPKSTAAAVLSHCGLTNFEAVARIEGRGGVVSTASSVQVREAIHTRNVNQWHRYAHYLGQMRERLAAGGIQVS